MRTLVIFLFVFGFTLISFGQKQLSHKSLFQTQDTSFNITLKMLERHGLWRMQCYQNRDFYSEAEYAHQKVKDSIQLFFLSKIDRILAPKLVERLCCNVIEVFNETKMVDTFMNVMDTPRCHDIHYEFQCQFAFDDSTWIPLHIYLDKNGELMHQSSILETLSSMDTYELPSRTELFERVYDHPKFQEYPVDPTFTLYYSEQRKLFYYEFIASWGEEVERVYNNIKVKKQHMFVDAATGKILWKPIVLHEHGGGSCTIWTRIKLPKNKLVWTIWTL